MRHLVLLVLAGCKGAESPQAVEVPPAEPRDAAILATSEPPVQAMPVDASTASDTPQSTNVPASSSALLVKGGLDATAVSHVVAAHRGALRACYNKKLAIDPRVSGKVIFTWDVTPAGRATNVKIVSSTFPDAEVPTCLEKQIANFMFPASGSPTHISGLPLVFVNGNP